MTWRRPEEPQDAPGETGGPAAEPAARRGRRHAIVLAVVGVLAIAAHAVLGGAVLAAPPWAGWVAGAVLAVVLVKAALIALGYLAHRRRKARAAARDTTR